MLFIIVEFAATVHDCVCLAVFILFVLCKLDSLVPEIIVLASHQYEAICDRFYACFVLASGEMVGAACV